MSDGAKNTHMKKVFSQRPSSVSVSSKASSSVNDSPVLSVPVHECEIANVSMSTLRNICSKAEKLIKSDGHIIKVPWLSDEMARLVKSTSSEEPHLVTRNPRKINMFCCDKKCQMFKGFSICSRVVATAQVNGQLQSYLTEINRICKPNFTAIANQKMPSGAGRKGGVCKHKCNCNIPGIETRSLRPCLESECSAVQTNFETVLPRSCGYTATTSAGTPSFGCVDNSPTVNITESTQSQSTIGTSAFFDSLALCASTSNTLPATPMISCVVSSPTVNVLDSTQSQIAVGPQFLCITCSYCSYCSIKYHMWYIYKHFTQPSWS